LEIGSRRRKTDESPAAPRDFTFVEPTELRPIVKIIANDAKPSNGSTIDVKKGGALRTSDATIAVAHNIEVKMLTAFMFSPVGTTCSARRALRYCVE
jgi:hypothetical protein